MNKEKQQENFDAFTQKLRAEVKRNAPLQIFAYPTNGEGFKYKTDVETFKKYGNNVLEFERYAKRYLFTLPFIICLSSHSGLVSSYRLLV